MKEAKNKIILPVFLIILGITILVRFSITNAERSGKLFKETAVTKTAPVFSKEILRTNIQDVWVSHVTWTRHILFCIMEDLPGTNQAVFRLLKNQNNIGDAIKPYYGYEKGQKLTELLRVHLVTAMDLLKAYRANKNIAFVEATTKWKANADEISEFLAKTNPQLKVETVKKIMRNQLRYTLDEAAARKSKNYDADVKAYESAVAEARKLSDLISEGIILQFPEQFKFKEGQDIGMGK